MKVIHRVSAVFAVLMSFLLIYSSIDSAFVLEVQARKHKKPNQPAITVNPPPDGPLDGFILEDEDSGRQVVLGENSEVGIENFGQQRWYQNEIPLNDFTSLEIHARVAEATDNWNWVLGGGVTLLYNRASPTQNCEGVGFTHGEINVCNQNSKYIEGIRGCVGMTGCTTLRGRFLANGYFSIVAAKVVLVGLLCDTSEQGFTHWGHCLEGHEIGHSIGYNHIENWDDQISVMGVRRLVPGIRDAQDAFKEYGGNGGYIVPGPTPECCGSFTLARDNNVHVKPPKKFKKKKGKLHHNRGKHPYKRKPGEIWPPPDFLPRA